LGQLDSNGGKGATAAEIVKRLRQRIVAGLYPPNSIIPSQRQLAEEFGVGRAIVRKALDELIRSGMVQAHHGVGTQVAPSAEPRALPVIACVHTPMGSWMPHEGLRVHSGIMDRLRALGYRHDRITYYRGDCCRQDDSATDVGMSVDDVARLPDKYAGAVFLEGSDPAIVDTLIDLEARRFPLVVANMETETPVSGATMDHGRVSREAVKVLASLGHKRIAFIGREPTAFFYGQSLEGFRQGMRDAGLACEPSNVIIIDATSSLSAYLAAKKLLSRPGRPTAVVAARDLIAQGVYHAAQEAGLAVGYDLSLVGFDDCTWEEGREFLTTFHEPCYEMGMTAVDMLVERLVSGWRPPERRVLDAPFVLRRSAGPVPREAGVSSGRGLAASGTSA